MDTFAEDEKIRQEIEKEIKCYSSFIFDDCLSKERVKNLLRKLLDDYHSGFESDEENVRILNFISYLQWRNCENADAITSAKQAKQYKTDSLVTLNNAIFFHLETDEMSECKALIQNAKEKRQKEKEYENRKASALAEIAYCYSRIGPGFHEKACILFWTAIGLANDKHYLWEFGLAMTLRRQSHIFAMRNPSDFNPKSKNQKAIYIFENIIKNCSDRQISARAWVELGIIMESKQTDPGLRLECEGFSTEECFKNANILSPSKYFVLQRYGQHLRHIGKYRESKKIFEESLAIQETPFAHHHLALTLRKMVLNDISNASSLLSMQPKANINWVPSQYNRNENQKSLQPESSTRPKYNYWKLKASVSSPQEINFYPKNNRLIEAVNHLKRALELNEEFDRARYDLGLTYRYLKMHKEAIECFSRITSKRWGRSSEYKALIINAYEQQGICTMEMADTEIEMEKIENIRKNGQRLLWKSLEVASLVISRIPVFKETIISYPTLKELLSGDKREIENNPSMDLARLYELVHEHHESIDLYKKLIEIDNADFDAIRKVIQNYIRLNDFDNAIHTLSLLQCTKQSNVIDKNLYVKTYLQGAKHCLENKDREGAKLRYMQAYKVASFEQYCECLSECSCCEVLVLCAEHMDDQSGDCKLSTHIVSHISSLLDVKVMFNNRDCLGGLPVLRSMRDLMQKAKYIMPIICNKTTVTAGDHLCLGEIVDAELQNYRKKIIAVTLGSVASPFKHCLKFVGQTCANFNLSTLKEHDFVSDVIMEISKITEE